MKDTWYAFINILRNIIQHSLVVEPHNESFLYYWYIYILLESIKDFLTTYVIFKECPTYHVWACSSTHVACQQ